MDAVEIGREIARLRKTRGWSQSDLANRLGTSQPSIARIEQGRTLPSLRTLLRIADALGVRLEVRFVVPETNVMEDRRVIVGQGAEKN